MNKWWSKHGNLVQWISSLSVMLIGSLIIFSFTNKYKEYMKMKDDILKKPNIEEVKLWDNDIINYVKEKDTQINEEVKRKADKEQFEQIMLKLEKMDDRIYELLKTRK